MQPLGTEFGQVRPARERSGRPAIPAAGAAHPTRRSRRPRRSRGPGATALTFAALLAVAAGAAITVHRGIDSDPLAVARTLAATHLPAAIAGAEGALASAGFGLDEVRLSGHRMSEARDILACIPMAELRLLPHLDGARARTCMEALPWVSTAVITHGYPGRVEVVVTERRPLAVWHDGPRTLLVDDEARVLAPVPADGYDDLPHITGAGAPRAAPALLALLHARPDIVARLRRADRIDQRRWALEFADRVRLDLPADGEGLAVVLDDPSVRALLAGQDVVIDARSRFEIAVRPRGDGPMATSANAPAAKSAAVKPPATATSAVTVASQEP